jgi:hypothetical protein
MLTELAAAKNYDVSGVSTGYHLATPLENNEIGA